MNLYIWRHSTAFSSWSVMEELQICKENYIQAEVKVLASSQADALKLLEKDGRWNLSGIAQIIPEVISLQEPCIISSSIS